MRLVHGQFRSLFQRLAWFRVGRGEMVVRTAGALAMLLIGLAGSGGPAMAQYAPPQPYPPAQAYPPPATAYPPYRPLPPVEADEDDPFYDAPPGVRPLPPAPIGPQV